MEGTGLVSTPRPGAAPRTRERARPPSRRPGLAAALVLLLLAPLLSACSTVERQDVTSWRQAVIASREQSKLTFDAVTAIVRRSQLDRIDRRAADSSHQLQESDFAPPLPKQGVDQWYLVLDELAAYAGAVEALQSPDLPAGVAESLRMTGEHIGATAGVDLLKSEAKLSGALGEVGRRVVAASAQKSAREVMLAADASIKQVTLHMADMLYATRPDKEDGNPVTRESGIVQTLRITWDQRIVDEAEQPYSAATTAAERSRIARLYASLLDQKAASVEAVLALRRGILDLAAAHTAAAQGRAPDLQTLLTSIAADVKSVKELVGSLRAEPAAKIGNP